MSALPGHESSSGAEGGAIRRAPASAADPSGSAQAEHPPEFLERLRDRDPDALARFYDLFFDRVYGYVRRMMGEEHLAEDLTQEIFMHVHRSLPSYDPARDLRPWVFTIATNKVRDYWRSRRFRSTLRETSADDEELGLQLASTERGPLPRLEGRELAAALEDAIERLPEAMRQTLHLRYSEGLSFEEIGRLVDRNEAAVRKRYSRALEELRRLLARRVDGGGAS